MSLMGRVQSLAAGVALMALSGRTGGGGRAYDAGRYDTREMASWHPSRAWVNDEVLANRDKVTDRARDMARNHPIIGGAIDRRTESVVGPEIRLEAQPAFEAMGRTAEWADSWATATEEQFRLWAQDPMFRSDVEMQSTFGGLVESAYRHWWTDGDALAVIKMIDRGGPWQTCIELVDPDRLSNPAGLSDNMLLPNGNRIIGGVEVNSDNAAVAYHIRCAHPAESGRTDGEVFRWERVARFGPTGRPQVIHAFKRGRAGQRRGISRFVAAIKRMKQFDRYDDAEIEAALLNSVMAAWVESPFPTSDVAEALAPGSAEDSTGWSYEEQLKYRLKNAVKLDGARVIHGLPGEKMAFHRAEHPSQNYPEFQATGLRSLAANFGLSYAQVAQNWADINYSSGRLMLNEIWRGLLHDRYEFTSRFCTPAYSAWLEESVANGRVKVPGRPLNFYKWKLELTMCEWMGPGRGTVDPLKESNADELNLRMNTTTLADIAADQGRDPRRIINRRAREIALLKANNLTDISETDPVKAGRPAANGSDNGDGQPNSDGTKQ